MPVPRLPGVPTTLDGFAAPEDPSAAADGIANDPSGDPQWGIFKDGASVVDADSFVSLNFKQEYTDADYPVEQGAFQSYDKVQSPFDVRIRVSKGGSIDSRTSFLEQIDAIIGTTDLYDVLMPEKTFENVNFTHRDFQRQNDQGAGLIVVELWGVEIRNTAKAAFSTVATGSAANPSTKSPSGAAQKNNGISQTEDVRVTATHDINQHGASGSW